MHSLRLIAKGFESKQIGQKVLLAKWEKERWISASCFSMVQKSSKNDRVEVAARSMAALAVSLAEVNFGPPTRSSKKMASESSELVAICRMW